MLNAGASDVGGTRAEQTLARMPDRARLRSTVAELVEIRDADRTPVRVRTTTYGPPTWR